MQKYAVSQFDGSTFQVVDLVEKREICVCSDYDEKEDARERAEKIAALLNGNDTSGGTKKSILQFLVETIRQI
jgi:hypothetical protein